MVAHAELDDLDRAANHAANISKFSKPAEDGDIAKSDGSSALPFTPLQTQTLLAFADQEAGIKMSSLLRAGNLRAV